MRYEDLLTLALSFTLSMGAYYAAQPDDVPVQHLEFEDYEIKPNVEVFEFEELLITAQADETDDGDGENLDMMNAHWCDLWPSDEICKDRKEEEEKEEEGC